MAAALGDHEGVVWDLKPKPIDPTYQPCTDTWKLEPQYNNSRVLIGNWEESNAKTEHERRPEHAKYLLPKPKQIVDPTSSTNELITIDRPPFESITKVKKITSGENKPSTGGYADGMLADARTRPYKKYFDCHLEEDFQSKCDIGSQCNPLFPSKLSAWHQTNLSNYTPEDPSCQIHGTHDVPDLFQFPMKLPEIERVPPFPYPKQWIVHTPTNYGYHESKQKEWMAQRGYSGFDAPHWGHDNQRNSIYMKDYTWSQPIKKKAHQFKFHKEIRPPIINDLFCPYRGVLNQIYSPNQTTAELERTFRHRTNHLDWRFYAGVHG